MKKIISMLCIVCCILSSSSCVSEQRRAVEVYNMQTDKTINNYKETVAKYENETEHLLDAIINSNIDTEWLTDKFDYADITESIKKTMQQDSEIISDELWVTSSRFYTSLGANSVTEIILFNLKGNSYLLEILWVDMKISNMVLEVL